jgi:ribonuclease J
MKIDDSLYFLPLGGAGEIGMNLYLYGFRDRWLMVDCGVTFGDVSTPGIDLIMPDPAWIEQRVDRLVGLVLTHAHEDHVGAIPQLWPRLRCPIYATPFTAAFLALKLQETDFADQVRIHEVPLGGTVRLDPFEIRYVGMTHSIPESNGLLIRSPAGTVFHTGDWKIDPAPMVGGLVDEAALRRAGDEGVLAVIGDSTNAMVPGRSGSEADARAALVGAIAAQPNRVAVTCFSSNVARLASIAHAAHAAGRHCALVGRSLWRIFDAAQKTGYLTDLPEPFVREDEAGFLPRDRVVMITTGSQGEPRAALTRIAADSHPHIVLEDGDTVIYSAREIPGNEKAINAVQNALLRRGVRLITPDDARVHVSGHPAREELEDLYRWLRPRIAVPVHGEERHMQAHAELAAACQVPQTLVPHNGAMTRLAPGRAEIVDTVPVGKLALDGTRLVRLDGEAIGERRRMIWNGAAVVTLVLDDRGRLVTDPQVALLGIEEASERAEMERAVSESLHQVLDTMPRADRGDDERVEALARTATRRVVRNRYGKKPVTEIHLVRV